MTTMTDTTATPPPTIRELEAKLRSLDSFLADSETELGESQTALEDARGASLLGRIAKSALRDPVREHAQIVERVEALKGARRVLESDLLSLRNAQDRERAREKAEHDAIGRAANAELHRQLYDAVARCSRELDRLDAELTRLSAAHPTLSIRRPSELRWWHLLQVGLQAYFAVNAQPPEPKPAEPSAPATAPKETQP